MVVAVNIVLSFILVLILGQQVYRGHRQRKLHRHRGQHEGLADLLNYAAMVDDGIIVNKNGSLMMAWLYRGEDQASNTDEQRNLVALRLNEALGHLGNGWMIHVDVIRRTVPCYSAAGLSHFPDPVSAAIDDERRRFFESQGTLFENVFVLSVTYLPPLLMEAKFVALMFDDEGPTPPTNTASLLTSFKAECQALESRLATVFTLQRLRGQQVVGEDGRAVTHDELLRYLQYCVTGLNHPVALSSHPVYLDAVLGGQELWTGVIPKIGHQMVQVVAIEGFPLESYPGILTVLAELPLDYRWSNRFIFMDQHEALNHLDRFRKKWKQKVRGFMDQVLNTHTGAINHDAVAMVSDAEAAMADVHSTMTAMGYYTSVVVLMHQDRGHLDQTARQLEKAVQQLGFAARIETINTMDAYLGSLPGHGVHNVRRPLINTMNLADFLPTSTLWMGEEKAPFPLYPSSAPPLLYAVTSGSTPFRLNLHVRDLGHTILFGPTGAGKSVHLALIAVQLRRYPGMSVFVFDKGRSMYPLTKAVGGQHYAIAGEGNPLAFCPLQYLDTAADRSWAMEWIDTIMALNGVNTTPGQRHAIGQAILNMQATGSKTLTEFLSVLQDQTMCEVLHAYTVGGLQGTLLDAAEDGLNLTDFITFEIEELMGLGEKFALPVLLYLFRRIERALTGQPAVIILDEAWLMLGHEVFREKIREWLKTLRKANCAVIMATQSLSDAARSGILDVIIESTATKIFLPNAYALEEDAAALYTRMGLNHRQREILSTAIPKRHYYCVSEQGQRLYELALGPYTLAFVGATDKKSLAQLQALEQQYPDTWSQQWADHCQGSMRHQPEGQAA